MGKDFTTPIGEIWLQDGSKLLFCYATDLSVLPELAVRERIPLATVEIFHKHASDCTRVNFIPVTQSKFSLHCPGCGMTKNDFRDAVQTIGDLAAAYNARLELPQGEKQS